MTIAIAALTAGALALFVIGKLRYRAGFLAGRQEAAEVASENLFDAGYRFGWRMHATLMAPQRAPRFPAPLMRALGLGATMSPIDEAERITRESADG